MKPTTTMMIPNIPTFAADEYPPARRVAFAMTTTASSIDDWDDPPPVVTEECLLHDFPTDIVLTRQYLTAMKVHDHHFAMQLADDDALSKAID